jgi:two-component SAPR family response regulator
MYKALVITCDESIINFIIEEKFDFKIRFTHNSDVYKGLKMLIRYKYDILIFDVDTPGLSAAFALNIAIRLNSNLHLILVTSDESILNHNNVMRDSIDFVQFKPISRDQLKSHLIMFENSRINSSKKYLDIVPASGISSTASNL